jgi:hypothetical protein
VDAEKNHRPLLREVSIAAGFVVFVALIGLGFSRLHAVVPAPATPSLSASPVSGVIPWLPLPANSIKAQLPKIMWPDQAAQDIRQTVTGVQPVLLPAAIPTGFQAQLYDDSGAFSVDYVATGGRKISFAIVVANPSPGTANVAQSRPIYRGVHADYQVDDATMPTSHRWLMWTERGTSVAGQPGVPYFLATQGMTESEFWQVANSIGPIPPPTIVRSCGINDLYAVSNGSNGATGHIVYSISLANHSATPCTIGGFPTLSLLSGTGAVIALQESDDPGGIVGNGGRDIPSGVLPANQSRPVPHDGGPYAYLVFEWYYCGGTPPAPVSVNLALPGSRMSMRVPLLNEGLASGPSRCDDPSLGHQLLLGPIQAPSAEQFPVQAPQWQATMQLPDQIIAGKTVDFTVTLTNISGAPFVFDTCPAYDEGFTPDAVVAYQLNCGPVGAIQAGASVTFAMRFTVPPGTPAGPQKFRWALRGVDAPAGTLATVSARG